MIGMLSTQYVPLDAVVHDQRAKDYFQVLCMITEQFKAPSYTPETFRFYTLRTRMGLLARADTSYLEHEWERHVPVFARPRSCCVFEDSLTSINNFWFEVKNVRSLAHMLMREVTWRRIRDACLRYADFVELLIGVMRYSDRF